MRTAGKRSRSWSSGCSARSLSETCTGPLPLGPAERRSLLALPDNAPGIVPPFARSTPQAPVILEPGQSACAAVRMSEGGRKENTETLKAHGRGMAVVKSPAAEGLAVNPQKWATGYWTPELRIGADDF
ncbi:hypothetical protein AB0L39_12320 [Streptomyces parvus]|uniref:hypothetical protein n=1 Tax=Streptomyces parvus TaxID=66428 RepID=UPI00342FC8E2